MNTYRPFPLSWDEYRLQFHFISRKQLQGGSLGTQFSPAQMEHLWGLLLSKRLSFRSERLQGVVLGLSRYTAGVHASQVFTMQIWKPDTNIQVMPMVPAEARSKELYLKRKKKSNTLIENVANPTCLASISTWQDRYTSNVGRF